MIEGELDKVNFQTAEQCSYVYMLQYIVIK